MTAVFVGLGANLGEPRRQLDCAIEALARMSHTRVIAVSSCYRSAPQGFADQPDFLNAVAKLETALEPRAFLDGLLAIEREFGRKRGLRNAPRTLDLDLLLYGDEVIDEQDLRVPHPRMHERAFVLAPLAQIAPECAIPGRGSVAGLLARCAGQRIAKLDV